MAGNAIAGSSKILAPPNELIVRRGLCRKARIEGRQKAEDQNCACAGKPFAGELPPVSHDAQESSNMATGVQRALNVNVPL
jgi:hypothetical protein